MSGRPESAQGGNVGSQASAVPQGNGRRRARPGSEGDTDQPAATHTRDEEAQLPQWTMSSSVEDTLLEGSTGKTEMKLNEFIRNYFGGRDVVDTNENVSMSVFVSNPEMFINDNEILGLITASQSYQELKIEVYNREIELDEREILLEAINRLHHEGVVSLGQWRDYERKDTVILLARAQINTAFSQVLRGELREAEERARRERQELGITVSSRTDDVVFEGRVCVDEMKLNDFLRWNWTAGALWTPIGMSCWRSFLRASRNIFAMREYWTKYRHQELM